MAKWALIGDEVVEANFKRAAVGWVFRAQGWNVPDGHGVLSPPWSKVNFVVSDAQKAALDPILRRAARFQAKSLVIAMLAAAVLLWVGIMPLHLTQLSPNAFALCFGASWMVLSLAVFALIAARRIRGFQHELRSALADAPRSDEGLTYVDRLVRQVTSMSIGKMLWGVGVFAIALAVDVRELVHALPIKAGASGADWGALAVDMFGIVVFAASLASLAAMMIIRITARRTSST